MTRKMKANVRSFIKDLPVKAYSLFSKHVVISFKGRTYIYTYIHTYIHIHTYTYIYIPYKLLIFNMDFSLILSPNHLILVSLDSLFHQLRGYLIRMISSTFGPSI